MAAASRGTAAPLTTTADLPCTEAGQAARAPEPGLPAGAWVPPPAWGEVRTVGQRLFEEPYTFDFFQAVRLLLRLNPGARPVGYPLAAGEEVVRFRAQLSLCFPPSVICDLSGPPPPRGHAAAPAADLPPPVMTVAFMGLTGPSGVLPRHYTELLLRLGRLSDREVREKEALRAWFDLFNHRLISLFYRAWEKYRFFLAYEQGKHLAPEADSPDAFVQGLLALIGLGTPRVRQKLRVGVRPARGEEPAEPLAEVDDLSLLYYSGFLAHRPRCAASLEGLLGDYFQLPVTVHQFRGQWLPLGRASQSRLKGASNNRLGVDLVAGERVWDAQSKFRVRVGPLRYAQFTQFLPNRGPGGSQKAFFLLCHLVRLYVGPELDFEVQLVLAADEVPRLHLVADNGCSPRLGWNTWFCSGPRSHDAEDATFDGEEVVWVGGPG
jgi:type VI secretion system protein ImpH